MFVVAVHGRSFYRALVLGLVSTMLLASMALPWLWPSAGAHEEVRAEFFEGAETLLIPSVSTSSVVLDGTLGPDEYDEFGRWLDEDEGGGLLMEHDGSSLYLAVVNGLGGWVAVGFGEDEDSSFDVKVAGWNGTSPLAEDRFMPVLTDELSALSDDAGGGTQDIAEFAASRDGATVFEFRFPLLPADQQDTPMRPGRLQLAFAAFGRGDAPPDELQGAEVHFFRVYTLRMGEDPLEIHQLLEGRAPPGPVPTVATIALVSLGIIALLWRLVGFRGGWKE